MPSVTVTDGYAWSGAGAASTALVAATGLEVHVTAVGGARTIQVPTEAIIGCTYTDPLDGSVTAELVIDRYYQMPDTSWLAHHIAPISPAAVREIQIVSDGKVVCWGPPIRGRRDVASGEFAVTVADADWWLGHVLLPGVDPSWGREWLTNPEWADGTLKGWFGVGPTVTPVGAESGFNVDLDGSDLAQQVHFPFDRSVLVRWTARVWVAASVPDATVIMVARVPAGTQDPPVTRQILASQVNRDQWQTVVVEFEVTNEGSFDGGRTATFRFKADGTLSPDVRVDETSVQVNAASLGVEIPERKFSPWMTQQQAHFAVIHAVGEQFNIAASADGGGRQIETPWQIRKDVYASEAERQITDAGGVEMEMLRTITQRVATLRAGMRGVEHSAVALTLEVGVNVTALSGWESGTGDPASEWIVFGESGFTGSFYDGSKFGGLVLQRIVAAPTGTADSELASRAAKAAQDADDDSESMTLGLPRSLAATVGCGDRVWLVADDGPDQFTGWVRVTSRTVDAGGPEFTVQVRRWEAA